MHNDEKLERRIRDMIIRRLSLDDIDPESIDFDASIFNSVDDKTSGVGLGLDSVDVLEIVVGLYEEFAVKVSDSDMYIFKSIRTIADYVRCKTEVSNEDVKAEKIAKIN
jgi:Phosphopantetheine attachment site.